MTDSRPRGRPAAHRSRRHLLLLAALVTAVLCAALPSGPRPAPPDRVMVTRFPASASAAQRQLPGLESEARARRAVRLVLVVPAVRREAAVAPPLAPGRPSTTWQVSEALLTQVAQATAPPAVLVADDRSVPAVAAALPPDVEVVGAHGALLRASAGSRSPAGTPLLRILGLIALGLLVLPSLRAAAAYLPGRTGPAARAATAPRTPPTREDSGQGAAPGPSPAGPPGEGYPTPGGPGSATGQAADDRSAVPVLPLPERRPAAPQRPSPLGQPAPAPPPFDVHVFARTLSGPESEPQCARCGAFSLAPREGGTTARVCARCGTPWQPDPSGRPPALVLDPAHFTHVRKGPL